MLVLGLTGGIACGKSTISLTLKELGAVIVDGDVLSRELTAENGSALPDIRRAFGDGVFHPDGTLNRRALGSVVFADDNARETQLARLMERDGFTREEAEARLRSQLPAEEKAARADVVIDTSSPIDYTKEYVISLYAQEVGANR